MADPALHDLEAIPGVAWSRLASAADDPADPMRLVTVATSGVDGRPSARLMVVRGADADSGRLWFHADAGSQKVEELRSNPACCIVAYDPATGTQLRLAGSAVIHRLDQLARTHFEHGAEAAAHLIRATDHGEPIETIPDVLWPGTTARLAEAMSARAWEHFAVIEAIVETIDWLQAVGDERRSAVLRVENRWRAEPRA